MNCPKCGGEMEESRMCPACGQIVQDDGREITAKINSEEMVREWSRRAENAREICLMTTFGAKTDLGCIRENNEDKFEFFIPEDRDILALKGSLYAVADGMGGHSAGQIASELALKTTIKSYYASTSPLLEESLLVAIQQANALIFDMARTIPGRSGMGTTLTILVVRGEEAFIAQVGDSRCYRVRGGEIRQITEDHSWVYEQVKRGSLTAEEAANSPYRNVITRSLGNSPSVEVDIFREELQAGDIFLLCSDGLSGEVSDEEMRDAVLRGSPSEAAGELVDLALNRGGRDNVTVLIVAVRDIIRKRKRKGLLNLLARS